MPKIIISKFFKIDFSKPIIFFRLFSVLWIVLSTISIFTNKQIQIFSERTLLTTCDKIVLWGTVGINILIFIFPQANKLFVIEGFLNSIYWTVEKGNFLLSFLFTILFISSLIKSNFFIFYKRNKIIFIIFLYLLTSLCNLRYGMEYFLKYFLSMLWISLLTSLSLSMIILSSALIFEQRKHPPVILDSYNISNDEAFLICRILEGAKYDSIARELNKSESSIKKYTKEIFRKFHVADRIEFTTYYSNRDLYFMNSLIFPNEKRDSNINFGLQFLGSLSLH